MDEIVQDQVYIKFDRLVSLSLERCYEVLHVRFVHSYVAAGDMSDEVVPLEVDPCSFFSDLAGDSKQRMRFEILVDDDCFFDEALFVDIVAKLRRQIDESEARGTIEDDGAGVAL